MITNTSVKKILCERTFFHDLRNLVQILKHIKDAVVMLQSDKTNLADCFIHLVKLAAAIKKIPVEFHKSFRSHCINKFNNRWKEFQYDEFFLAFFLHPLYRGKFILKNKNIYY